MSDVIHLYMPDGGEAGVIQAWLSSWPEWTWVEFRGLPYSKWESYGWSPFRALHDLLPGWYTCVLHTDSVLDILRYHKHYGAILHIVKTLPFESNLE